MKFERDYSFSIGVPPYGPPQGDPPIQFSQQTMTITPPYTLEFDIRREFLAAAQTANFKLYNLGATQRNQIYKDRYTTYQYAAVSLNAGYKGQFLPQIFLGTVYFAASERLNCTNIVTNIESQDGGFSYGNSYSNFTLPAKYPLKSVFQRLNQDLVETSGTPIIGTLPTTTNQRPLVMVGPTYSLIQKMVPPGVSATIDTGQLKILADTDGLQFGTTVFNINSASGLLDPPVRNGTTIVVKILFEPRITLGQIVQLTSIDNPLFNGQYQVRGVSHQGIISPAVGGQAITTIQLYLGPGGIKSLSGAISE